MGDTGGEAQRWVPVGMSPRAQALLRGRAWVVAHIWAKSVGAARLRALPFFILVVSPCRCEPLRASCCGGEGVLGVS